ncbi:MAG: hypothetical protein HY719_11195 [Planctomycetes bacterium]|nr:hypothetical protein [Planctomycetota bacterium]
MTATVSFCASTVLASWLVDAPLLLLFGVGFVGVAAALAIPGERRYRVARGLFVVVTLAAFWGISTALYLDGPPGDPDPRLAWMYRRLGAECGRDFVINSGVFGFEWRDPSLLTTLLGGFIFATYPIWLWFGLRLGERLFARRLARVMALP